MSCVNKYYEENKEKIIAYNKKRYKENKEKIDAYKKKYRQENKEKVAALRQSLKAKYIEYKSSAKKRNIPFNISLEEFQTFWQKNCHYCGSAISTIGLDRIDSSLGYELENLRSCCTMCNRMKLDSTEEQWYDKMLTILKHQKII